MWLDKMFQSILWEFDLSKLNLDDNIVAERVLSLGDKNVTDFWIKELWKDKAKELFIKNKKNIDKKSLNYWNIIFYLEENNLETNRTMYDKLNTPVFSRSFGWK